MRVFLMMMTFLFLPSAVFARPAMMCTMDAKQCPDGSYVSRQPPDCSFAPCPGEILPEDDGDQGDEKDDDQEHDDEGDQTKDKDADQSEDDQPWMDRDTPYKEPMKLKK